MATLEQENEARSKLKEVLSELAGITAAGLVRDKDLGPDLSFEPGVIFFSRTLRLFHALHEADLQDLSHQKMGQLQNVARATRDRFKQIEEFSLQRYPSNPMESRQQFIEAIRDNYDNVLESVAPVLAFTVRKGTDFERLEEQGRATLKRIEAFSAEQEQALTKSRTDAESLVQEVRKIAQESGVSQHAVHFEQEAAQHQRSAENWLKATVSLASTTVAAALIAVYFGSVATLSAAQSVQVTISKVLVLSVLLSATFWAGRTYRAHRHNAVINRHRQNALGTFLTFAKAATDDPARNAVLLQATQCIFSPQQTGYVSGESEAGALNVLEIARTLGLKS